MVPHTATTYSLGQTVYTLFVLALSGACVMASLILLLAGNSAFSNYSHLGSWATVILLAPLTFVAYLIGLRFARRTRLSPRLYVLGGLAGPAAALLLFLSMIVKDIIGNF